MSESNDTLSVLLMLAAFLHVLTLLGMTLHTALLPDSPGDDPSQDRTLTALLLGRAPIQRTAYSRTNGRLLTASALLLASASASALGQGATPVWTTTLAVLALLQLACAYAWYKPGAGKSAAPEEQATQGGSAAGHDDHQDPDHEEVTREHGSD
ncbi:hypothetical protein ABZW47_29765 [Streptomyces sp. NPDC004549]|uniref:hypothetical protein n=1 Tax=Streptomyces sp. NPDC004549 TaxID=3154283 RepID=UPI0033A34276